MSSWCGSWLLKGSVISQQEVEHLSAEGSDYDRYIHPFVCRFRSNIPGNSVFCHV